MDLTITGKVVQVLPLQQGTSQRTGNPWQLKTFILETQEQYPKKVAIEMFGEDKINANPCEVDDVVTVNFDIDSREFNGRWYTSIRAWKVQQGVVPAQPAQPAAQPAPAPSAQPMANAAQSAAAANTDPFNSSADESTDLPF